MDLDQVSQLRDGGLQPHLDGFGGVPHIVHDHIQEQFATVGLALKVLHLLLKFSNEFLIFELPILVWRAFI